MDAVSTSESNNASDKESVSASTSSSSSSSSSTNSRDASTPPLVGWYPSPPPSFIPNSESISLSMPCPEPNADVVGKPHPLWTDRLRYTSSNIWSHINSSLKEGCRRHSVHGVEVRDLPPTHPLHGEQGLFALRKFDQFDILGEYTGLVTGPDVKFGHYLACLEDKDQDTSLGINAEKVGNEMRFINSFRNIAFAPNVTMRTAYIGTYPHLLLVATQTIEPGDEIVLDYGRAYDAMYILPKERIIRPPIPVEVLDEELPQYFNDDES